MKIKNLKISKKVLTLLTVGTICLSLTGCGNYDAFDTKYNFNKAIIFGDKTATVIEIEKWTDYDGEQIQITTKDGMYIVTSSFDTKLVDDKNSKISVEDLIIGIAGEDVVINYLDEVVKTK